MSEPALKPGIDADDSQRYLSVFWRAISEGLMSFDQMIEKASREERFMATVYAMNTLLIHKGVYTQKEFEVLFLEWMRKEDRKKTTRPDARAQAGLAAAR